MKNLIVFILFFASFSVLAQEEEAIITDRPSQSASAFVVPQGSWLVEYGTIAERTDADNSNITYANVLIRYGIVNGVEIRLTQDFVSQKNAVADVSESGLSPLTIGSKIGLYEGKGWVPVISAIAQVTIPTGNEAFNPSRATPELRLNFANALSDRFSLAYNFGMRFPEEGSSSFYTALLGYSLPSGWTFFAEPYAFFGQGVTDHRFNSGIIYLIKNNLQVDITAGWGLSEVSPDSFVGFGLAVGF